MKNVEKTNQSTVGIGQVEKVVECHITATPTDLLYASLGRIDIQIDIRNSELQQLNQSRIQLLRQIQAAEQEAVKKEATAAAEKPETTTAPAE